MENDDIPWINWCLLCGNNNLETKISIYSNRKLKISRENGYDKMNLKEVLEKYFRVHRSQCDLFPNQLCTNCNAIVSSFIAFNERVDRVQQMYRYLVKNVNNISLNLVEVRDMFDVCGSICDLVSLPMEDSKEFRNIGMEERNRQPTVKIMHEDWSMESDQSASIAVNDSLHEDEDFADEAELIHDTISPDSVWGDDYDEITKKNASDKSNKKEIYYLPSPNSYECQHKKNKPINEDFVIDVVCTQCEQKFDLYSDYCDHMEMEHNCHNSEKYCPICNRNLGTWYHLGRHLRSHMPDECRFPIKCPECDSRFTTSSLLETHINHKHKNEKPFICEICGFCGSTKTSLSHHMYVHTEDAPFECDVCHKRFKLKSRLNFHMDIHAPHKYVCTICGLQLNSRATLKNHFLVHSDSKRHKCEICNTSFKRSKSLKAHLILHVGLTPYACNFCDQSFSNRSTCRSHMKKDHPNDLAALEEGGNKAYTKDVPTLEQLKAVTKSSCNIQPVFLRGRLGRKSDEAFLECNFCDRKFNYRSSRRSHMKLKHPEEFSLMETGDNSRQSKNFSRIKMRKSVTLAAKSKPPTEPVSCEYCGRSFGYRKLCQGHIKRIHPNEWSILQSAKSKTSKQLICTNQSKNEE